MDSKARVQKSNKNKRAKKKCPLYLGKETYGDIPIERAFKEALEPYFNPDDSKLYGPGEVKA